ncbi:MAG: ComEA family DNA-binding protein, partial [Actinobacteria bacterium]|nr:ComEA family DNA-binding protein [Actinomycetota bacterium]
WRSDLHFTRVQIRSLLALIVLVLLVSAAVVNRGNSVPIAAPAPLVITPSNITVDVAGGVKKAGVYSLPENSRVVDAIAAAGGAKPGTDLSDLNLARVLKDGEQIFVEPAMVSSRSINAPIRPAAKSGPININRATEKEFDSLPGVGPVIAARIVAYRKVNGPFSVVEDVQKVSGIGSAKFAQFKNKIRV